MSTKYVKPGNTVDVVAGGTVAVNDVDVIGTGRVGVATLAGGSGDTIPYAVRGVWTLPKASAADISQGEQVLWDVSAGNCDDDAATPATGDFLCGWADADAGVGATTVNVHINEPSPAVT